MGDESYDAQFRELDYDTDIENELAQLKGGATPLGAGAGASQTVPALEMGEIESDDAVEGSFAVVDDVSGTGSNEVRSPSSSGTTG
jgi:hypothetical protein